MSRFRSRPLGTRSKQQPVPFRRTGVAFGPHGEGFGVPVRNVEFGFLQREDMHVFVLQHSRPVERFFQPRRRGHRDDHSRRSADRLNPRQADHPGAEPLMGRQPLRLVVDFDLRPCRRLVAELLRQLRIDLFEILGHVLRQQLVEFGVGPDHEVFRLDRFVAVEHLKHLPHVADADVKRIGLERRVQQLLGLFRLADLHVEQAELRLRLRKLRHRLDGLQIDGLGGGVFPQTFQS